MEEEDGGRARSPTEAAGRDETKAAPTDAKDKDGQRRQGDTPEDRRLLEEASERLQTRRKSSISDWELLQRPDDCPNQEDADAPQGSSSSPREDAAIARPAELSGGAAASQQSSSKPHRGELSPSFINPSPRPGSSEDSEDSEAGGHRVRGGDGDVQEQASARRRSQRRQHASKQPCGVGGASSLAGEETPPTSASESLPSHSDSDVPPETEDCPSITPEGNLDSDEDADHLPVDKLSASGPRPPSPRGSPRLPDPAPAPAKDPHPQPPPPGACMVDPEVASSQQSGAHKLLKSKGPRKSKGKPGSPAGRDGRPGSRSKEPAAPRRTDPDRSSRPPRTPEHPGWRSDGVKNASGGSWPVAPEARRSISPFPGSLWQSGEVSVATWSDGLGLPSR